MAEQYNGEVFQNSPAPLPVNITSSTNTTPIQVRAIAHGLSNFDDAQVNNHTLNNANGLWTVEVIDADNVILLGSVGTAAGVATGTIQSMNFADTFEIPDEADDATAASIDVALEALGDRTSLLAEQIGQVKEFSPFLFGIDDATENAAWTEGHVFASTSTWEQIHAPGGGTLLLGTVNSLNPGDYVEVDFGASFQWTDSGGDGIGIYMSLFVSFYAPGGSLPTPTKLVRSARALGHIATTVQEGRSGFETRGAAFVPADTSKVNVYLYGFTRNATPGHLTVEGFGDWQMTIKVKRPTFFNGRVG